VKIRVLLPVLVAAGLTASLGACSIMDQLNQQSSAFDLEIGTCFNSSTLASSISQVPAIACTSAHDAEIIATGDSSVTGDYDQKAIEDAAATTCGQAMESYVGLNWIDLDLTVGYLYPDETAWHNGKRTVLCYAHTADGQPTLTASVQHQGD